MNFLKSLFSKIVLPLFALSLFSVAIYFSGPLLYKYFTALMPIIIIVNPGTSTVAGTAYGENIGYILFLTDVGSIATPRIVDSNAFMGYGISQDVGYISLNCANTNSCATSDYKVTVNERGHLSGYAYGENIGYINFDPIVDGVDYGVTIDENGYFHGWAYSESVGWISFNCENTNSCTGDGGVSYKVVSTAKFLDPIPTTIQVSTQPMASSCSNYLAIQPAVLVQDQYGYSIEDGTTVTASISGGTGQLLGTITAQTVEGVATFSDLGYDKAGETFSISFSAGDYSVSSNPIIQSISACGGAEGFISTPLPSSSAIIQNVEDSTPALVSGGSSSVSTSTPSTTPQPSSAPPQQTSSGINPEEIKTYTQDKIDLIKQNIPHGQGSAFSQIVLVLQQMVINLKGLLGFVN